MAHVPIVNTKDPASLHKALRAVERLLDNHERLLEVLVANKPLLPLGEVDLPPDNAPIPLTITTTASANGSLTVKLTWRYTQGTRPATQMAVFLVKGTAPLPPPTAQDVSFTIPATAQQAELAALTGGQNYRFGIAAAREGPDGFLLGPIQAPTANPDWADITAAVSGVPGAVTGVISTVGAGGIALPEATWVGVGTLTCDIPTWATDTKVVVMGVLSVNVSSGGGTPGVYQMLWRVRRGGTVLFAPSTQRFDSASTIGVSQLRMTIGPFMDQTTLTGSVVYEVDVYKDDIAPANHTASVGLPSQTSAMYWSY